MSDLEPNDALWNLLGRGRTVEPSAFFARNVVREVRAVQARPSAWDRLRRLLASPRGLIASAGGAFALLLLLQVSAPSGPGTSSPLPTETSSETFDPASELAAVEYLGQLMAVADPGQLDDAALGDLFF